MCTSVCVCVCGEHTQWEVHGGALHPCDFIALPWIRRFFFLESWSSCVQTKCAGAQISKAQPYSVAFEMLRVSTNGIFLMTANVILNGGLHTHFKKLNLKPFRMLVLWCHQTNAVASVVVFYLHDQLMGARHQSEAVGVVKGFGDVLSKGVAGTSRRDAPPTTVVGV